VYTPVATTTEFHDSETNVSAVIDNGLPAHVMNPTADELQTKVESAKPAVGEADVRTVIVTGVLVVE
jgi:hypothetical protein